MAGAGLSERRCGILCLRGGDGRQAGCGKQGCSRRISPCILRSIGASLSGNTRCVGMIRPYLALHYYSTQEESCEARRFLSPICSSSMVPREPCMLMSAWSAWLKLGHLVSRCPHGECKCSMSRPLTTQGRRRSGMPRSKLRTWKMFSPNLDNSHLDTCRSLPQPPYAH